MSLLFVRGGCFCEKQGMTVTEILATCHFQWYFLILLWTVLSDFCFLPFDLFCIFLSCRFSPSTILITHLFPCWKSPYCFQNKLKTHLVAFRVLYPELYLLFSLIKPLLFQLNWSFYSLYSLPKPALRFFVIVFIFRL